MQKHAFEYDLTTNWIYFVDFGNVVSLNTKILTCLTLKGRFKEAIFLILIFCILIHRAAAQSLKKCDFVRSGSHKIGNNQIIKNRFEKNSDIFQGSFVPIFR